MNDYDKFVDAVTEIVSRAWQVPIKLLTPRDLTGAEMFNETIEVRNEMQQKMDAIVKEVESKFKCNCAQGKPEPSTGHACTCRIHKIALEKFLRG